jgi:hypothetical protein
MAPRLPGPVASAARQDVSEEARKMVRHEFGFSFLVYRDRVQAELGLTPDQKGALEKYLRETAPADMAFLQANEGHQAEFESYRSKARESLDAVLKQALSDAQRKRLNELVRQREGLFGGPSLWAGLDITDEEKAQFMAIIEPMSKRMQAAAAEAQHATDRAEIERKVLGLRAELERKMEAVLTDAQRQRWLAMLGKPVAVETLFDTSAG